MLGKCCFSGVILLALASSTLALVKMIGTPVVYTNSNGGGSDEVQAPAGSFATKHIDAGSPVVAAWWTPLDNIGDLVAISHIEAKPSGNGVDLVIGSLAGQRNARIRLSIYAEVR